MPTLFISIISVLSLAACASPHSPAGAPTAQVSPTPGLIQASPESTISLDASQKVEYPPTAEEKKRLLAQFKKTLIDQEKTLDREQRAATKDFASAQSQQLKEWRNQEKKARQVYFDQHLSGPDRRAYVQSYISRKKDFDQTQKNDLASFKQTLKEKQDVFKVNQKDRLIQFQSALDRNQRPSNNLWSPR